MTTRVTLLGATGSIGCSAADVIASANAAAGAGPRPFEVVAVVGGARAGPLADVALRLGAKFAALSDPAELSELRERLAGTGIASGAGASAVQEAADMPSDRVIAGIVGAAGVPPTLTAIRRGAIIGLANKESIVCAGPILLKEAWRYGAQIVPCDSEHSAVFQAMTHRSALKNITLTASGGPFREASLEAIAAATPEQACAHPVWSMGRKNSVDSATMMNKGLEVIEACYLFDLPERQVEVLIHPEAIVHSMATFVDGSSLAQLGDPDMKTPIAYALSWPDRIVTEVRPLDLAEIGSLSFFRPDKRRFPALDLARAALNMGPVGPVVFNAANGAAVEAFLIRAINFPDIVRAVDAALAEAARRNDPPPADLDAVMALDAWARRVSKDWLKAQVAA